ncbi:MAG: hypothetical protein EOS54_22880 [Mesorhizobium sp.]|uniref:hypothetical protein n=1 Tax=unclassified Mesorhizobium TaxID=325217 RepID=UPI000F756BE5|nr:MULTISPECIES: hypothetical protein [unclassified Mesorhizobium]AZO51672.1 hypothetical protein EJ073_31030 [Mesorhizobium sp. M4B.F.Ca.ET.058.02.1.1]RVC39776.1 hypothetical protein EN781_31755 [Mesorhizobium sp. M4A.F.Ca.ET.090.04.2.1]RWC48890.1 MAG: hypothetical protein EOS54_22880 [Mesorhizobium sp.]RWD16628.1 MAG: hypothetical protein EOS74_06110 [Mesorhizobium sp.]RWD24975.1 MAG: hypothetical protein EOS22_20970 [Mesorhizobium sp.]
MPFSLIVSMLVAAVSISWDDGGMGPADGELETRLRRLGNRLDEIKSAKLAAAPRDRFEKVPIGPDDPDQIAIVERFGIGAFLGPGSQLAGLASLVAFLKALRRTNHVPSPAQGEGRLAHSDKTDQ